MTGLMSGNEILNTLSLTCLYYAFCLYVILPDLDQWHLFYHWILNQNQRIFNRDLVTSGTNDMTAKNLQPPYDILYIIYFMYDAESNLFVKGWSSTTLLFFITPKNVNTKIFDSWVCSSTLNKMVTPSLNFYYSINTWISFNKKSSLSVIARPV